MGSYKNIEKIAAAISSRHTRNRLQNKQANKVAAKGVSGVGVEGDKRSTTMLVMQKFIVKKNECGMLFKNGDFQRFLDAGTYHFVDPLRKINVELFDLSVPEFQHRLTDFIMKQYADEVAKRFDVVELTATQVALVYKNKRLAYVLAPATRTLFWKGIVDVEVQVIDIAENYAIDKKLAAELAYADFGMLRDTALAAIYCKQVPEYHVGVLYVDGECVQTLKPGLHAYWRFNRNIRVELFDTRVLSMEVAGQEILTKDKVNLRINLSCSYQIKDALAATSQLPNPVDYIYRELQFGLRAAVGTRTLDALLDDKGVIDDSVAAYIKSKTNAFGISIADVGVKDIILPGDMKTILSKVVEAEKVAQANSIRRREETAATRSMLNTAKVMEDNPTALRLKELETLEKVTEKVGNLSVFGGLDGVLNGLVKIN
ncbi:slipin family protein [Kaarinaea lacus]